MVESIMFIMSMFLYFSPNILTGGLFFMLMYFYLINWGGLMGLSIYGFIGGDVISFYFVFLTLWAFIVMNLSDCNLSVKEFFYILLMVIFMILSFSSLDLFMFYLFFESSMVPILLLIWGWGGYLGRLTAGTYLFIYTMITSFPMLMILLYLNYFGDGIFFFVSGLKIMSLDGLVSFFILLMFMVKVPMFFLHIWLPKAHVEAPVYGSMILASVMLKLGGYGIIRVLSSVKFIYFSGFLLSVCMVGGVVMSIMCIYNFDFKVIVAYSSVVHMGTSIGGLMSFSMPGFLGAFYMMLSHAFSSSGLFFLVNVIYLRFNSRLLLFSKGLILMYPTLVGLMFFMIISSLGIPPSLSLISEIMIMIGLFSLSGINLIFMLMIMILSAFYLLKMYCNFYGISGHFTVLGMGILMKEYTVSFIHMVPINLFMVFINHIN